MSTKLCQLVPDWTGTLGACGALAERKHDGWRALRFRGTAGQTRLWTRNGMPIQGAEHVASRLDAMERAAGEPMFFDGEFIVDGTLAATKTWCERGWKHSPNRGTFHAFDCLTLKEWQAGGTARPLIERKEMLADLIQCTETPTARDWDWPEGSHGATPPTAVQLVEDEFVRNPAEAIAVARRVWSAGGEGIVLKLELSPYQRTRSPDWAKVKMENADKWQRN